jgi:RNA polymerase sigma-70 factor (ECF subfamily)
VDFVQEKHIIDRVLGGEREAFAELVDGYAKPIFNLAFRMTGDLQDADDLAQETFLRAYQNLRQFNPDKRFFTWLYTIALNVIRNNLRWKRLRPAPKPETTESLSEPADLSNPETLAIEAEKARLLEICLQKLPADLREAVVLRYYQDLSFDEISAITNSSVSAVKMRTYRALERLRKVMVVIN